MERIILGIDPGYERVGWAVGMLSDGARVPTMLDAGCIFTPKSASLIDRYQQIDQEIVAVIERFHPQEVALESLFFQNNQKTAMHVSEARGVLISVVFRQQLRFFEYTPLQIKQAVTGFGRADKAAVAKMVRMQLNTQSKHATFDLHEKVIDDTMDAIAIVLTQAAHH